MKLVKEAYKLLASDPFKSILLIIQTAGFIILFNLSLGTVNSARLLSDKVEKTSLKNAYYYSYGSAEIQDTSNNSGLNDIEFQNYFCPLYNERELTAYCLSEKYLTENQLKLKNGAKIGSIQKNECLISSDLAKEMKIKKGEKIELTYNGSPLELTVRGIVHKDEQIIKYTVSGNNLTLKAIYTKLQNTIILTSCDAVSKSDMRIFPCGIYKNAEGLTEKEINDKFGEYGEFASFEKMLKEENEENQSIVMLFNSLAAVLLIVTFINVTANNFLILKLQEKRFAIYFLYGMSFGEIYKIISIRSAILIGISYIISAASLSCVRQFSFVDEFSFNALSFIASLAVVALMTAVSEIPLYIRMKKAEPIRFFAESLR